MITIGELLKEKRLELGYSLDDMSEKTKLSKIQLKAIEEGNISFFKDDLSYLSYFVRYYANALGINYNDIRNDLDNTISGFTNTLSISKVNEMERIEQNIASSKRSAPRKKTNIPKVDFASAGIIALALAILLGLGFVFVKVIVPAIQSGDDQPIVSRPKPPNTGGDKPETPGETPGETPDETPGEKPDETPGEKPDETPGGNPDETPGENPDETPGEGEIPAGPTDFNITAADARTYHITNWKETDNFVFEVQVNVSTTLRFTLDGTVQATPQSGVVYKPGERIPFSTQASANKTLDISIGYPFKNKILINGVEAPLDPSVTGSKSATTVSFRFIGE